MKKAKRLTIISCVVFIFLTYILSGWSCWAKNPDYDLIYTNEAYISAYSSEQHIERLSEIVENKYVIYGGGTRSLKEYSINIVYSFDDKPEYFLLEMCWENVVDLQTKEKELNYSHMIGIIYQDKYYYASAYESSSINYYRNSEINGKSFYSLSGVLEQGKKLLYSNAKNAYGFVSDDGKIMGTKIDKKYISKEQATLEQYDELQEIASSKFSSYAARKRQYALLFWREE